MIRVNKQEVVFGCGEYIEYYPSGSDNYLKFTGERVQKIWNEAYLCDLVKFPTGKLKSDLHFEKIIRKYG